MIEKGQSNREEMIRQRKGSSTEKRWFHREKAVQQERGMKNVLEIKGLGVWKD